jgi:hypothetical protein
MKSYPSISKLKTAPLNHIFAFDKLDGSNIRAEWNRKHKAFTKFGSRTQLIDKSSPILGEAIDLFLEKYSEDLNQRFTDERWTKAICFFEFFGDQSFAGQHIVGDPKKVMLFDINGPSGLLYPKEYLKLTKYLDIAPLIYEGPFNQDLISMVENGTLPHMTFEGIVAKANTGSPGLPWMTKVKNKAWLEKLKVICKDNEALFNQLA